MRLSSLLSLLQVGHLHNMANCAMLLILLFSALASVSLTKEWGDWYPWTSCSVTCGVGTKIRERHCTVDGNPTDCVGDRQQREQCFEADCSEKPWSSWTQCADSLCRDMVGHKFRWRDCQGSICNETAQCTSPEPCRRDGGWSNWGAWSECSATCGEGYHYRRRSCNNPRPKHRGTLCHGPSWEMTVCLSQSPICYKAARFTNWGDWGPCRRRSGGCRQQRRRDCEYPPPTLPGSKCNGTRDSIQDCECA